MAVSKPKGEMMSFLEGKEVEGNIGSIGGYYVDADATGKVVVSLSVKKDIDGHTTISSDNKIETHLFQILEKVAEKTSTTLDDKAIAGIKAILGMI